MEREDVLEMLNENLRLDLIVHMNGKILNGNPMFKNFNIAFISELIFELK